MSIQVKDKAFEAIECTKSVDAEEAVDRSVPGQPYGLLFGAGQIVPGMEQGGTLLKRGIICRGLLRQSAMKKLISLIMILAVISTCGFCLAADEGQYKTRGWLNGFYWDHLGKLKDDEAKMAYILGLMDGINIAQGFAKDTEKLLRINQIMEGLIPKKIKEAIDMTFSNELNRKLPVYIVLILEIKKMKNEISPEEYDRNLDELRKMYESG